MDVDGVRDGVQVGRKVRMTNEGPAAARCDLGGKSSRPGREASLKSRMAQHAHPPVA